MPWPGVGSGSVSVPNSAPNSYLTGVQTYLKFDMVHGDANRRDVQRVSSATRPPAARLVTVKPGRVGAGMGGLQPGFQNFRSKRSQ